MQFESLWTGNAVWILDRDLLTLGTDESLPLMSCTDLLVNSNSYGVQERVHNDDAVQYKGCDQYSLSSTSST